MTADSSKTHSVVLYGVKKTAANEAYFWDCCCNIGHFLCGVERVKRYVYNLISVLYFVTNTICVNRLPFVATSRLACG